MNYGTCSTYIKLVIILISIVKHGILSRMPQCHTEVKGYSIAVFYLIIITTMKYRNYLMVSGVLLIILNTN